MGEDLLGRAPHLSQNPGPRPREQFWEPERSTPPLGSVFLAPTSRARASSPALSWGSRQESPPAGESQCCCWGTPPPLRRSCGNRAGLRIPGSRWLGGPPVIPSSSSFGRPGQPFVTWGGQLGSTRPSPSSDVSPHAASLGLGSRLAPLPQGSVHRSSELLLLQAKPTRGHGSAAPTRSSLKPQGESVTWAEPGLCLR